MGQKKKPASQMKAMRCNNDWLFATLIRHRVIRQSALEQALDQAAFDLLDTQNTELVAVETRNVEFHRLFADALVKVPFKEVDSSVSIRVLLEHKSHINVEQLITQLLRYQTAFYEQENTAIVVIVINNGQPYGEGRALRFQHHLNPQVEDFWRQFGTLVLDFQVLLVNLQDQSVERRHRRSDDIASFVWYVMSRGAQPMDHSILQAGDD